MTEYVFRGLLPSCSHFPFNFISLSCNVTINIKLESRRPSEKMFQGAHTLPRISPTSISTMGKSELASHRVLIKP